MQNYECVSADSHLEVPPSFWEPYVDKEFRQYVPKVVKLDNGGDAWKMYGTDRVLPLGLNFFSSSKDPRNRWETARITGVSYSEGLLGAGDAQQRLDELDIDGVDAEVLFPAVAGQRTLDRLPAEAYVAVIRGYNDWLSQEFTSVNPDRLFGLGMIPPTSVDDAVDELQRVSKLPGIRGVSLHQWPNGSGGPSPDDDRFWEAAINLNVPLCTHGNFGGGASADPRIPKGPKQFSPFNAMISSGGRNCYTQAQLITEGVLDRFPDLRVYFAETGIQWIPGFMEMADHEYLRHRFWAGIELPRLPSEYIKRHFHWSFQQDNHGLRNRHDVGVDNIMWATDFPHMATDFPESRQLIKEEIAEANVSPEDASKIYAGNCLRYFHITSN
jgi:uncharacterized protein